MAKSTHPIVLGTAGHIDHGKTALVGALTGIETDRLKEEKERGITTELGFAYADLGGRRYGVVDVPGHERFIKSMVAGATGLDLVCLVIAADEGVMPQTREHLDICELLGVRRGVVALTKSDLVDEEWTALMSDELRASLAGTFLEEAPIVPVSAKTGAGMDELRRVIIEITKRLDARPADGVFRLPLDRIFSIRGFGTVVTGTVASGRIKVGDSVLAMPRGVPAKVRGIEVHGAKLESARAGVRCALNIAGPGTADLARGDCMVKPETIAPAHLIDARFRYLSTSKGPLKNRARVLLHQATTQVLGNLVLVDKSELEPGEEGLVQLRIDAQTPLTALPGDRFIARGFALQEHYGTTIGGGEILRVHAPKAKRREADAELLAQLASANRDERLLLELKGKKLTGITVQDLVSRLGWAKAEVESILERLVESGDVVSADRVGADRIYCHALPFATGEKRAQDLVREREEIPRAELREKMPTSMPAALFEVLIATLVRRGAIEEAGDMLRMPGTGADPTQLSPLARSLADRFEAWGLAPPRPKNVATEIGEAAGAAQNAMNELIAADKLIKVKPDLYVGAAPVAELQARLKAHLEEHSEITPAQWKVLTGVSRKFSIPLAEYFDQIKFTLRVGDVRRLR